MKAKGFSSDAGHVVGAASDGRHHDGDSRFSDSAYLRGVLVRIAAAPDGWRTDPEVDDLLDYVAGRFAQLARKHGLTTADGMSAAFEAMRLPSVRGGRDPWAVIVTAVATTLRAWQFADEALTSIDTARRGGLSGRRAERFSERETPVWEHHPAFTTGFNNQLEDDSVATGPTITEQAEAVTSLFVVQGWDAGATVVATEQVMRRLADAGTRPAAYETLRRDRRVRAMTGLPAASWTALLRLLLGTPTGKAMSAMGKGILVRLACGEPVTHLADDQQLAAAIWAAAPARTRT